MGRWKLTTIGAMSTKEYFVSIDTKTADVPDFDIGDSLNPKLDKSCFPISVLKGCREGKPAARP